MKRNVSKIFKQEDFINVYQTKDNSNLIYKEYLYVKDSIATIDEMKQNRKKLLSMKNRKQWPEFLIRPNTVERFNKYSYTASFPFVEGMDLHTYMKTKDIDIHTLAKFIKKMEESIYNEQDFVFPDFANPQNIVILPKENDSDIDFKLIDSDDIQFDQYKGLSISSLIIPAFNDKEFIRGFEKCKDGERYNKQLDIRSMYALLYYIINGKEWFIPPFFERDNLSDYERILELINIPINSSLYEKSMNIVDEKRSNVSIGDSLFELINNGYELKTYDTSFFGYKHKLRKK